MADVTKVQPLKRAYRWRDENNKIHDFGIGATELPAGMAKSLIDQGLVFEAARTAKTAEGQEVETDLPEDLPGRAALLAAGHVKLADVQTIEDFQSVDGIGEVTAGKIVAYLGTAKG